MYNFDEIKEKFYSAIATRRVAMKDLKEYEMALERTIEKRNCVEEAQVFLQKIAQDTQNQLKFNIEDIVQLCLDTCYPDKYEFKLEFVVKRGKTEAKIMCLDDGEEIDIMHDTGGGVSDLIAFGLRIAVWSLGRTRNVMILDEPGKFLDVNLKPRFGDVIRELSRELKLQFLLITHDKEVTNIADRIFHVTLEKEGKWRKSHVEVIDNSQGSKNETT